MIQESAEQHKSHMEDQLDAVHAVFALPEVERATGLLPELVGLIGSFLTERYSPVAYRSIYAHTAKALELHLPHASSSEEEDATVGSGSAAAAPAPSLSPPDKA
jgi:hypothetical protein